MLGIVLALFSAFSFLLPEEGNLAQSMGFSCYNPADVMQKSIEVRGHFGTLDTKEVLLFVSSERLYFRSSYASFGEIEVRGTVPDDNSLVSSFPYLFNAELGSSIRLSDRAALGASFSVFEQRILSYDIKGYLFNFGAIYEFKWLKFAGYLRNIGQRVGYFDDQKYSVPIYGSISGMHERTRDRFSAGFGFLDSSPSQLTFFLGYTRKVSEILSLGGEILTEKDLSLGYRLKYPFRFMISAQKGKTRLGLRFDVPMGGFDIKTYAYLGVGL